MIIFSKTEPNISGKIIYMTSPKNHLIREI